MQTLTVVLTALLATGISVLAGMPLLIVLGDMASPACTVARGWPGTDVLAGVEPVRTELPGGVRTTVQELEVCGAQNEGITSFIWSVAPVLPGLLLATGLVALMHVLLGRATRWGLFSLQVADTVRLIGWLVIAGSFVSALATACLESALLEHLVPGTFGVALLASQLELPGTAVVAGVVVLTVARALRVAVRLREDVEATI